MAIEAIKNINNVATSYYTAGYTQASVDLPTHYILLQGYGSAVYYNVFNKTTNTSIDGSFTVTSITSITSVDAEAMNSEDVVIYVGGGTGTTSYCKASLFRLSNGNISKIGTDLTVIIDSQDEYSYGQMVSVKRNETETILVCTSSWPNASTEETFRIAAIKYDGSTITLYRSAISMNLYGGRISPLTPTKLSTNSEIAYVAMRRTSDELVVRSYDLSASTITIIDEIQTTNLISYYDVFGLYDVDRNQVIVKIEDSKRNEQVNFIVISTSTSGTFGTAVEKYIDLSSVSPDTIFAQYSKSPIISGDKLYDTIHNNQYGVNLYEIDLNSWSLTNYQSVNSTVEYRCAYANYNYDKTSALLVNFGQSSAKANVVELELYTPPNLKVKVNGAWKDAEVKAKVNGTWKDVDTIHTKINGVWKETI